MASETQKRRWRAFGYIIILCWATSLLLPFDQAGGPGYLALLFGWLLTISFWFGWYANIFLIWNIGRLLFGMPPAIIPGVLGFLFAYQGLKRTEVGFETNYTEQWAIGFYLWYACLCALLLAAVAEWVRREWS